MKGVNKNGNFIRKYSNTIIRYNYRRTLAVASAYVTLFEAKATQKAKVEIEKLNDERQRKIANATLDKVDELLRTNIVALENTVKKDMLVLIEDGKIEKDELKKLAQNVKENVLNQLGEGSIAILNETLGDVNGYLEVRIEEKLAEIKKEI